MAAVLVFGHRNPDNDSICSAVAYAHLKNVTDPSNRYIPGRLGPALPETEWVLSRFGIELPEEVEHVHPRVGDVMTTDVLTVEVGSTMLDAGRLMRERDVRTVPVVEHGVARGVLNQRILAEAYLGETEIRGFGEVPVSVGHLVDALDGELLVGHPAHMLSGDVLIGAMEPETMRGYIKPGDTIILGDRRRTQPMALEAGVACLIVSGGRRPDEGVLRLAEERGAAVIVTHHDTFGAARLVNLSHTVGDVMDTDVLLLHPGTLLSEAAEDMLGSNRREAVVVDAARTVIGILTRTNLARGHRRRVVLVDHNEVAQSAPGIEDAAVIEVVDHHRIGDIQTNGPILFLNIPVGATATVVALRYEELGVPIPPPIAGILLAAILTDTVLLKSPTTTPTDHAVALRLAGMVGVDPVEFGLEMFRARSAQRTFDAERAVKADLKEYRAGDTMAAIGQVETVDIAEVMDHADEVIRVMESLREARGYDLVLLMVTDVVREGSQIIAVGKTRFVERALGVRLVGHSAWMDGVLSRKKQVAARLVDAAGM